MRSKSCTCSDLDTSYRQSGSQDRTVIMGDLNVKVGYQQDPLREVVGCHGLGRRNERVICGKIGCVTHEQVLLNTWFQHHNRHLYTWREWCVESDRLYYNNKRFLNSIQ